MKNTLLLTTLLLSSAVAQSATSIPQHLTFEVVEDVAPKGTKGVDPVVGSIDGTISNGGITGIPGTSFPTPGFPQTPDFQVPGYQPDRTEQAGKVIQAAKDIVALGEDIYTLVQKGKPTNVTEYAPISVVPKDPATKEVVDPFELEGFSMPVQKNFTARLKDGGKEVINFKYKVLYSYGGSYNGAGKYLTGVIIIPGSVKTNFGWNFTATMRLSGIMNHGTKASPIAGVMITVKYQMNGWNKAHERNDTVHITGAGQFQSLIQ